MKLITKLTLTAVAVLLYKLDHKAKQHEEDIALKRTQKPIEPIKPSNPNRYATARIDTSSKPIKAYLDAKPIRPFLDTNINKGIIADGIITSTTPNSKYTPKEIQAFYKINPYTNYPFHISLINT